VSEGARRARPVEPRSKKHWAVRLIGWLLGLVFLGVIGAVATFFIGYALTDIPDPNKEFKTNTTLVTYSNWNEQLGTFYDQNRLSIPLEGIPKHVQDAAIAAEDRTFWTNPGVEPTAMMRAAWNIARGQQLQGGSTITQQYVKILYLTQERTWSRKMEELFIATKLSRSEDKGSILEGYLNTIYFGEGAYGIRAAGIAYFSESDVKKLTVPQAAYLATVLNNPSLYDPNDGKAAQARTLARYRYVLDGMRQMGTITSAQYAQYSKALPAFKKKQKSNRYAGPKGFLLDMARKEMIKLGYTEDQIDGGGLRIRTTFDKNLQLAAQEAVQEEHPKEMDQLHIGLASVRPQTGELVAVYGGPDYLKSQLNWATSRARPGSSFKPFAVAAALKDGKSLRDRYQGDSPIVIDGEEYNNEFDQDYGNVSLLKATEDSINTAFYDLVDNDMEDGPSKVVDAALAAGIPKTDLIENDRSAPANVLGPNAYASPAEMAGAYGTFAAGGQHADLHVINEIRNADNQVLWTSPNQAKPVFDEEVAADTTYALEQVVRAGTGRSNARKIGRPAAGKTGTAGGTAVEVRRHNAKCKARKYEGCTMKKEGQDTLTSWWVGFTPQLSTAVLYRAGKEGESDLDPYSSDEAFFGGNWPARTWLAFMEPAHEGLEEEEFPEPSSKNRVVTPRSPRDDNSPSRTPSRTPTDEPSRTPTDEPSRTPSRTPSEPTKTPPTREPTKTPPTRPTFPSIPTGTPRR
jgi:membrane peptidoglycan carboxypeptidase